MPNFSLLEIYHAKDILHEGHAEKQIFVTSFTKHSRKDVFRHVL